MSEGRLKLDSGAQPQSIWSAMECSFLSHAKTNRRDSKMLLVRAGAEETLGTMPTTPIITYIRVSTSGQGRSGLGIEAQRHTLAQFAQGEGLEVAREFVEV